MCFKWLSGHWYVVVFGVAMQLLRCSGWVSVCCCELTEEFCMVSRWFLTI